MTGWRWKNAGARPLLFCHATGFCASAYKPMLSHLDAGKFDVYALDMRGHGRNTLPANPEQLKSWQVYADDIQRFLDVQDLDDWILSGHSMGAVTAAMASKGRADISELRLIEPVAVSRWMTIIAATPAWKLVGSRIPLVQQAAKRRSQWESPEAVFQSYSRKGLFKNWRPGALESYLRDGLKPSVDGGVELSCTPAWEAATFAAQANDFWGALEAFRGPVSIFAADHPTSTVSSAAAAKFKRYAMHLTVAQNTSHLAPMEEPAELAAFLCA
ncbi:alpha/beta hydrolase [Hyphococcus flavus]|uniref:Alpha/beta hydrolase n=1 Tax=Hyphococcus flavus TaxID=1866326 RepID=A0AAE9ZLA2_9PROT|nr:alpha/beta hydrolase [Hyphococcus flavus]WDI33216.1 alpha/beta hydrolase [Hyphococcus flavus]